jgi:hypothetical protein
MCALVVHQKSNWRAHKKQCPELKSNYKAIKKTVALAETQGTKNPAKMHSLAVKACFAGHQEVLQMLLVKKADVTSVVGSP